MTPRFYCRHAWWWLGQLPMFYKFRQGNYCLNCGARRRGKEITLGDKLLTELPRFYWEYANR